MAATADDTIARHDVAPRASEPIESTAGRDRGVIDSGGVARVALETRSSRGLVLAVICFPIVLCGCIVGWLPLGWRSPVAIPSAPIVVEPSPTTEARLPDLPIAGLPGAPPLAVWAPERDATIRVSMWRADTLHDQLIVPLLNRDPVYLDHVRVSFSPNGKFFAVIEAGDGPTITRAFVRIFSSDGELVWTAPRDTTATPTIRWSPDGTRFTVDARLRWFVVTPLGAGHATMVEIDTRRPLAANGGVEYPWELLDFSEDGRTLFGSRSLGLQPHTFPLARAPSTGGPLERLAVLPTEPGRRLAPLRQLLDDPLEAPIDPETGRVALITSGGSGGIEVTVRAGTRDRRFTVTNAVGGPLDMAWQHGSLVILHDGPDADEQSVGVVATGADLGKERRVTSFPIVGQHARLVAVIDGYVVLAFGRGFGEARNRLVLVKLSDGAMAAIDGDGVRGTVETFGFGGWVTDAPSGSLAFVGPAGQ
jgi:hypothetical protein